MDNNTHTNIGIFSNTFSRIFSSTTIKRASSNVVIITTAAVTIAHILKGLVIGIGLASVYIAI